MALPEFTNHKPNYLHIFKNNIESIPPKPEEDQEYLALPYNSVGIRKLKRELAVVSIGAPWLADGQVELWVDSVNDFGLPQYPHEELREQFCDLFDVDLDAMPMCYYNLKGYLLQDDNDRLHLLVNEHGLRSLYLGSKNGTPNQMYAELLDRYSISSVIGQLLEDWQKKAGCFATEGTKIELIATEKDLFGQIRENKHWEELANRYKLSNFELLRVRALARSSFEAGIQFDSYAFAEEMAEEK
ncbi:MAG: hypothetical protein WC503_06745 [Candidatus Shapirobacteria bacterium]